MTPESLLTMPIPRDIPLGMPAYPILLELALVLLFLLHILFVNLMLGGSILAFVFEIMGRKRPDYDRLAREIVSTITVNKSMAVVLGVGPLLTINVLYTLHFYTANAITGRAWIMVVPLVAIAFLLGYVHKYTWDRYAQRKELHLALGASSTLLLLIVPLIFLSNINLMLFPEKWKEVDGWLASLLIPNVFPRYLHFLMACLALTGLFLTGYFGRSRYPAEEKFETLKVSDLRKIFLSITLGATVAQLVVGPLVFFHASLSRCYVVADCRYLYRTGFSADRFRGFVD